MQTFFEFFAGGGMARAGLGEAWHCLFSNDFDEKKAVSYAANWGAENLVVKDVAKVRTREICGEVDLVWASFPCQDLSLAGDGAGLKGSRSGSFWPFWRLIETLVKEGRPPALVVLENVCGTLTSHGGTDFAAICTALTRSGFRFGAMVLDAVHFLPQLRPRLFIAAPREQRRVVEALAG
jgi:DNA (cytosine-5)-methyltransferase 1